jgi:hypothetical protein
MASSFCEVPPGFFCLPGDVPADQFELSMNLDKAAIDGSKLPVDGPKPPVDGFKPPIDRPEARVHRSFELGDGHGLSRVAHHSIVVTAMTMPDVALRMAQEIEDRDVRLAR